MLKLLNDPKAYEVPKYASLIVQLRGTFKVTHLTGKKYIAKADVWIHVTCKQADVSVLSSINWSRAE